MFDSVFQLDNLGLEISFLEDLEFEYNFFNDYKTIQFV